MKQNFNRVSKILIIFFLIFSFGCASHTTIKTIPPGAKVYIEDEYKGETPYKYEDKKIVGSRTYVKLKKDGYKELKTSFQRSEEFDPGPCLGGVLVGVPFLWIMKYKNERIYELEEINTPLESEQITDKK